MRKCSMWFQGHFSFLDYCKTSGPTYMHIVCNLANSMERGVLIPAALSLIKRYSLFALYDFLNSLPCVFFFC